MGKIIRYGSILLFLIAAIIAAIFLPRRDLRTAGHVAGIALDEQAGRLMATFELYAPSNDQPIGENCILLSAEGETLEECINNVKKTAGKELFLNDVSALILGQGDQAYLLARVSEYYREFKNDNMDLPIFFAQNQSANAVFDRKGKILSTELNRSSEMLKKRQTVRDLLNGKGTKVYIKGAGTYEIIS